MSRFPLLPLLLSFSTTLQSACLQDKCALDEFKNNDSVCKSNLPNWTLYSAYKVEKSGTAMHVDSIGMINITHIVDNSKICYFGRIAIILAGEDQEKQLNIMRLSVGQNEKGPYMTQVPNIERKSINNTKKLIESASFSSIGVSFFAKYMNASAVSVLPWFTDSVPIEANVTTAISYFSLSSDADGRVYALIKADSDSTVLLATRSHSFLAENLIEQSSKYTDRYRVLAGNVDGDREPELLTWDQKGDKPVLYDYSINQFIPLAIQTPKVGMCSDRICPVALGDLNQDGVSDLIVADQSNIKIYYGSGSIDNPFPMVHQQISVSAPVHAIAVSIPNGDDPPKLVWATSTFIQDSGKSTGTNTITINVLTDQP